MTPAWERFAARTAEMADMASAIKLLHWDQAVMMPAKGTPARARAMSTLETMAHQRLVDTEMGDLLSELSEDDSLDAVQKASVRILKRDFDKATRLPKELVRASAEARGKAYQAWVEARPARDFEVLRPHLEELFGLRKQEADAIGWEDERYDALLDDFEPGLKTREVAQMFDELAAELKPVAEAILAARGPEPKFLGEQYDKATQERFCLWLVEQVGFDTTSGRLDTSPHPFTAGISRGDVRQTIRAEARGITGSVYAALHETGHALYDQGLPEELADLPAGSAPSLGMHESQSRMWENHVGRSRGFTRFMLPHLKEQFGKELSGVGPDDFYLGVNYPKRSHIRVYADEVTYNLHLILRFQMELALFRDELEVKDLPGVWNEKSEEHLGIRPEHDGDGVLQDMHWAIGAIGYFPTYTLGTLYAAAFFEKVVADLGDLSGELARGDGSRLHGWLNEHVYKHAYILPGKELGEQIIGGPLTVRPFIDHLKTKYGELFKISF